MLAPSPPLFSLPMCLLLTLPFQNPPLAVLFAAPFPIPSPPMGHPSCPLIVKQMSDLLSATRVGGGVLQQNVPLRGV